MSKQTTQEQNTKEIAYLSQESLEAILAVERGEVEKHKDFESYKKAMDLECDNCNKGKNK